MHNKVETAIFLYSLTDLNIPNKAGITINDLLADSKYLSIKEKLSAGTDQKQEHTL